MKPRKVLLSIETTTNCPLSILRKKRGDSIYFYPSDAPFDLQYLIAVEQIQVNVMQDAKQAGRLKKKRK